MIIVLLPAYNEAEALPQLLPKIQKALEASGTPYRIIVGDDGSRDSTFEVATKFASSMPIEILRHKINRGLGETIRDLFERAAEVAAPEDVVVRMDADDTHDPKYIHAMVGKIDSGYDVVTASRFQPGGGQHGVTGYRAFVSRGANLYMRLFFRIPGIREYSCGFRAYRASILQEAIRFYGNDFIQLKGLGFTCTLEKLVKLKILGARFAEVPFELHYEQKRSASKMLGSVTTFGYLVMGLLYHWPWGGWKRGYGARLSELRSRTEASGRAGEADATRNP